jgi:hypothetical protein
MLTDLMIRAANPPGAAKTLRRKRIVLLVTLRRRATVAVQISIPEQRPRKKRKAPGLRGLTRGLPQRSRDNRDDARKDLRHGIDPAVAFDWGIFAIRCGLPGRFAARELTRIAKAAQANLEAVADTVLAHGGNTKAIEDVSGVVRQQAAPAVEPIVREEGRRRITCVAANEKGDMLVPGQGQIHQRR